MSTSQEIPNISTGQEKSESEHQITALNGMEMKENIDDPWLRDPANPRNWPNRKKWASTSLLIRDSIINPN